MFNGIKQLLPKDHAVLYIILLSVVARGLLVVAYPYLIVTSDGGDGNHFYQLMLRMAIGDYQGNLQFATGYPFLGSFLWQAIVLFIPEHSPIAKMVLLVCQHLVGVITTVLVYKVALIGGGIRLAAIVGAGFFAIAPIAIAWAHHTRPTFLAAFFVMLALYAYFKWENNNKVNLHFLILIGIAVAAGALVRNFPIVLLPIFMLLLIISRTNKRIKIRSLLVLFLSFFITYFGYIAVIQYGSTGSFKMRGMGFGAFTINVISYRGLEPNLLKFDRRAGDATNRVVAYSNYIRKYLPPIPISQYNANLAENTNPVAPYSLRQKLASSITNHHMYAAPDKNVDQWEYAYYLGVSGYSDLMGDFALEQFSSSPSSVLKIIAHRFLQNFFLHQSTTRLDFRFPSADKLTPLDQESWGFVRLIWPPNLQKDRWSDFSFYPGVHFFDQLYEATQIRWWVYVVILTLIMPSILRMDRKGRFCFILLTTILVYYSCHAIVSHTDARHNVGFDPLVFILFGYALVTTLTFVKQITEKWFFE